MTGCAAVCLVGLLTLSQEIDRLVEMFAYEEAGLTVAGQRIDGCRAEAVGASLLLRCTGVRMPGVPLGAGS